MLIKHIAAREILNSGATASIEVKAILEDGSVGVASVPFGASTSSHEAFVLFDGGSRYAGKGMQKAVLGVNTEIRDALIGMDALNQELIDKKMIELDATPNKSRLGSNAILGASLAVAHAASKSEGLELYEYIKTISNFQFPISSSQLPKPMIVVIEGGKHADNSTDFQEYLIVTERYDEKGDYSVRESVRCGAEVYLELKKVLKEHGYNTNIGNEGAYAPEGILRNDEPWELLAEAVEKAGYIPGTDVKFAVDPACSEILVAGHGDAFQYQLKRENRFLTPDDLIDYFAGLAEKYPFISLEDILAEDDWSSWTKAFLRLGDKVRLIGDDLLATNPKLLERAIQEKACNGILIKLNQIGTLSETINTINIAKNAGFWTIVSHRGGGETNDVSMIDLACASGSEMVKVGIARGERVCKYNRLMEIEEKIKNAK